MEVKKISTFKVAATYIGTIVGAGFASGQEILQFFVVFGNNGLWGLILVTTLFIAFGYLIMDLGQRLNSKSHLKIIQYTGGKYLGGVIDFIITFFLFGALTAMIAGSGAMFNQTFNVPTIWGNLLMAIVTAITVLTGIRGVINSISFVVPFLLVSAVGVSIFSIFMLPPNIGNIEVASQTSGLVGNWFWSAILYTSYNTLISIAILGPLGANAKDRKTIRNGAILGGLGLGLGAIAIYFALFKNLNAVTGFEIPMVFIAGQISFAVLIIYSIVLLAEVYTTAVGSLFGFTARFAELESGKATTIVVGATIVAFLVSLLGFSNLVKYLYPVVGYGGVVLLVLLIYSRFKVLTERQ